MNELFTTLISLGASVITGFATFLFTRKKYLSEVSSNEIDNMRKSLQFYIDIVEDNKVRIEYYQAEIERCNAETARLRLDNVDLRKQVQDLSNQVILLMNQIKSLQS